MMRAIVTKRYGSADVLELQTIPNPRIKASQVLVRIHATSINPIDWKVRSGKMMLMTGVKPPRILGADLAGVVSEVGHNVTRYKIGDEVWGKVNAFKGGAYAEYLNVNEADLALKPQKLSFEEAASVPTVGLTAYQSLVNKGRLQPDHHVMINGCSGGVGLAGLQIARARGCEVTGTCSPNNFDLARSMGADHVIDYSEHDALRHDNRYDIFFDAVGTQSYLKVRNTLKARGIYVTTIPSLQSAILGLFVNLSGARKMKSMLVKSSHQDLDTLKQMVENGDMTPLIEKVYSLDMAPDAHRRSETGRVAGKLVLKID